MKTKVQVQKECIGTVYTLEEFCSLCEDNLINSYDGHGYFHDGEKETDINVFSDADPNYVWKHYHYICCYNK